MRTKSRKIAGIILAFTLIVLLWTGNGLMDTARADGEKTINGLGTRQLSSWDTVQFGGNSYFVLSPQTNDFGGSTMLLMSLFSLNSVRFKADKSSNIWADSDARTLLNTTFLHEKFLPREQAAIANSIKPEKAAGDGVGLWSIYLQYGLYFAPLTGEKVFLLDAVEVTNPNFGFENNPGWSKYRQDIDEESSLWLRSPFSKYPNHAGCTIADGSLAEDQVDAKKKARPALNVDLSYVLFTSQQPVNKTTKMTIVDKKIGMDFLWASRDGEKVTVHYSLKGENKGSVKRISALMTDATWDDSTGWVNGTDWSYVKVEGDPSSGTGTFLLSDSVDPSWNTYLLAEDVVNDFQRTDYASAPVLVDWSKKQSGQDSSHDPKKVPKTGDSANPVLWLFMIMLGLVALSGVFVRKKNH